MLCYAMLCYAMLCYAIGSLWGKHIQSVSHKGAPEWMASGVILTFFRMYLISGWSLNQILFLHMWTSIVVGINSPKFKICYVKEVLIPLLYARQNLTIRSQMSVSNYFERNVPNDINLSGQLFRHLWQMKKYRNGRKTLLKENDKLITSNDDICEIFNDYFIHISTTIGFVDSIVSTEHAIEKHANHSSVIKTKDAYKRHEDRFSLSFNCVKQDGVR